MKKSLILLTAAWVLIINGSDFILSWLIEILRLLGVDGQTFSGLPFLFVGLQILLYGVSILLAYLSKEQAALKPLAVIAIAINCLSVINAVAATIYSVASGQIG